MRRPFSALALACVCSLAFAACGGKGAGKAGEGTGAEIAPAGATAFLSIAVDPNNPDWQRTVGLIARVPVLRTAVLGSGKKGADLSELQAALGKTVGIVLFHPRYANSTTAQSLVVLAKPADTGKLEQLLAGRLGKRQATREVDGWLVLAASRAALDDFSGQAKMGTLAGSHAFRSAFKSLSKNAPVRVYLRGDETLRLAASRLSRSLLGPVSLPAKKKSPFDWIALSLQPGAAGLRLDGIVSGIEAKNAHNPLPIEAPAGSLVAATVNGSSFGLGTALNELAEKDSKLLVRLGLGPGDLATLSAGKLALSVVDGASLPQRCGLSPVSLFRLWERSGFALELRARGAAATARKLERLLPLVAAQLKGNARRVTVAGAHAGELTVGAVRLYVGAAAGKIFIASAPSIVFPGSKLSAAPAFLRAERVLQVPAENAGVLYVDLERVDEIVAASSISTTKGHKRAGCSEATKNPLEGLSALLAYLSSSGNRLRIKGVLSVG